VRGDDIYNTSGKDDHNVGIDNPSTATGWNEEFTVVKKVRKGGTKWVNVVETKTRNLL
jgi:hypothetical protein